MRKILLIATLVLTSSFAHADDVCHGVSQLAGWVMAARQQGVSVSEMQQVSDNALQGYDDDYRNLFNTIIKDAYQVPRYLTNSDKHKAINNFSLGYYQECKNFSQTH